jgi:homoserine kinase type II
VATFTALGTVELSSLATTFGLGTLRSSRAITAGTINSNFAIETDTGSYFLRVNEGKSEADVAWESRLVGALAARGVIAPEPLPAQDGRLYAPLSAATVASDTHVGAPSAKWVSAFAWRSGHHLAADAVTTGHAERFGVALAALHLAGLELPVEWRRTSIYDLAHLAARFATIERVDDPDLAYAITILRDELAAAGAAAPIRAAATHGIIHGDLFRDNVLWDGDQISAILDFEQASGGSLAYDLAVCINDWCWSERAGDGGGPTGSPRLDLAAALISGYQRVRPLTAGDREALPCELRASAMRFTITRITDVYLAEVPNPEKDFRAFLARCEAWRSLTLRELTQLL